MAGPEGFPRWIVDVEEALVDFLTALCQDYFEDLPGGSVKGKAYRYGGQFEVWIEMISPPLPAILVRYNRSDFVTQDEEGGVVERLPEFEIYYVFYSARGEDEAREGCTQVMEKVIQELTGKSFEGVEVESPYRVFKTGIFQPRVEEFFYAARGIVVYRQLWETSRIEE